MLIYNIGSKYNLTVLQLVKKIAFLLNINKSYATINNTSKKEIINQRLNYKKISRELKWKPVTSMNEGLIKKIKW